MGQLDLFTDKSSKKHQSLIRNVGANECTISRFNTRKTRPQDDIDEIAVSIADDGFELTSAPWAYRENGTYHVFAGGTRLLAAQQLGATIPLIIYEGYTEQEISHLSDKNNEQDGMHKPVPITDVWAEYARLSEDEGWTQEEIADAKGVNRTKVSRRISLHQWPDDIKKDVRQGLLAEGHLEEIDPLCVDAQSFSPWLTTQQAQLELAEWAANGHTTRETRQRVNKWKEFIQAAGQIYEELDETITLYDLSGDDPSEVDYHPRQEFVNLLGKTEARSLTAVKRANRKVTLHITKNLEDYKTWVDARTAEQARKAIQARREQELLSGVRLGIYQEVLGGLDDDSVDLIFTDPPYDEEHIVDYGNLAKIASRVLKPKGSLIVYAGHYALPQLFEVMCPHLTYWWQLIVKHGGNAARQPGKWIFVHYKPLLWFTKDGRRDNTYVSDFIHSEQPKKQRHEWEQDVSEAMYCIKQLTSEGDLVVDPFCGSGTTAIAAAELEREFIVSDMDKDSIDATEERLLKWLDTELTQTTKSTLL